MTLDTQAFVAFLRKRDYAEQTVKQTAQRAVRLEKMRETGMPPPALPPHWRTHLLRIMAGSEHDELTISAKLGTFAIGCLRELDAKRAGQRMGHGLRGGRRPKQRAKVAQSVPDEAWVKLLRWLEAPKEDAEAGIAAAVLCLEAETGLRVGDVLRIPVRDLDAGMEVGRIELEQKGGGRRVLYVAGAGEAWKRLQRGCGVAQLAAAFHKRRITNVASCMCPSDDVSSSGCAYKRCERLLKQAQKELGLDRLHTHRLRRTMAVQALRLTGDVHAVGEALGHTPGSKATHTYLDEARPERVAELTKQVREKFGGQ